MAERHWTALGVSPQVARRLAMLEAHLGLTEGTVRTPVPGYTANYLGWDEAVYDVEITGGSDPYTGVQTFPVAGGGYAQPSSSLQIGGPTWDGVTLFLYEKNGRTDVPVGAVVRACYRGVTGTGDLITEEWEFEWGGGTGPQNTTAPLTIGTPSTVPTPASPHVLLQDYNPSVTTFNVPAGYTGIASVNGALVGLTASGKVCILCGGAGCSCCKAGCSPSPEISDFTWVNQGTATVRKNDGGSVTLRSPDGSVTIDTHHLLFSIPAQPYRIDLELDLSLGITAGNAKAGIGWRQSSDGKLHLMWLEVQGGDSTTEISGPAGNFHQKVLRSRKLDAPDTLSADYAAYRMGQVPRFWRLQDDGTNRTMWWSMTGHPDDWLRLDSQTRTNYLTADGATIFADAGESEGAVVVICCLKRYAYQSTDTTTYEDLSQATVSDIYSQTVDVTYEDQSSALPLAETTYEDLSSATTTDAVSQTVDVTYEDQSTSALYSGPIMPVTMCVDGPPGTHVTLTNVDLTTYRSDVGDPFTYNSVNYYWQMVWDQSSASWILQLRYASGGGQAATYEFSTNDLASYAGTGVTPIYLPYDDDTTSDQSGQGNDPVEDLSGDGALSYLDGPISGSRALSSIGGTGSARLKFTTTIADSNYDFVFGGWFRTNLGISTGIFTLLSGGSLPQPGQMSFVLSAGYLNWVYGVGTSNIATTEAVVDDEWFFAVVYYNNATAKIGIYVNGVLVEGAAGGMSQTSFDILWASAGAGYENDTDEILLKIGSSVAPTQAQLDGLYNGGDGIILSQASGQLVPSAQNTYTLSSGSVPDTTVTVSAC